MGAVRPPLDPRPNVPMIGTGDLLRYNAGEPKPISLPILGALVDLTGDGKRDLVGTVIYTYSPDRPPGGIVCYPRVGGTGEFRFGDPVAIRYLEASGASEPRHLRAGYLHLDAGDLNGDGRVDLVYASPADGSHQNPRSAGDWIVFLLNTGRRDDGGLPIFQDHGRISRPRDWWGAGSPSWTWTGTVFLTWWWGPCFEATEFPPTAAGTSSGIPIPEAGRFSPHLPLESIRA